MIFIIIILNKSMVTKLNHYSPDTDSLTYEIEAGGMYQDFWKNKDKFDNREYPENSPYFDKTNKKVIGKLWDSANRIYCLKMSKTLWSVHFGVVVELSVIAEE